MKEIITALAAASKALKALPPAPVFDRAARKALIDQAFEGLPERFRQSALEEAEKKFIAENGDTGERAASVILSEIAPAFGGIETLATIAGRMAKKVRTEGKISVTGSQWRAALEGKPETPEHSTLLSRAAKLRADEKPWSKVAEELGLSDASQSQLYLLVKDGSEHSKTFATLAKS